MCASGWHRPIPLYLFGLRRENEFCATVPQGLGGWHTTPHGWHPALNQATYRLVEVFFDKSLAPVGGGSWGGFMTRPRVMKCGIVSLYGAATCDFRIVS